MVGSPELSRIEREIAVVASEEAQLVNEFDEADQPEFATAESAKPGMRVLGLEHYKQIRDTWDEKDREFSESPVSSGYSSKMNAGETNLHDPNSTPQTDSASAEESQSNSSYSPVDSIVPSVPPPPTSSCSNDTGCFAIPNSVSYTGDSQQDEDDETLGLGKLSTSKTVSELSESGDLTPFQKYRMKIISTLTSYLYNLDRGELSTGDKPHVVVLHALMRLLDIAEDDYDADKDEFEAERLQDQQIMGELSDEQVVARRIDKYKGFLDLTAEPLDQPLMGLISKILEIAEKKGTADKGELQ